MEINDESAERTRATRAYPIVRNMFRLALRIFFRRIEVEGIENIPERGGGLIIAWHPNGVIDGMLVATECPRPIVFGARHGLIRFPVFGWILRCVGTVPIYRATDVSGKKGARQDNTRSLGRLAETVAGGSLTALFPESVSHDRPHPVDLKKGAARLFDMARDICTEAPPSFVLPVGIHYDVKDLIRSSALVRFHPPLILPAELTKSAPDESEENRLERHQALTEIFERTLHEVVHATEDWRTHQLGHRVRKLIRAELACRRGTDPGPASLSEKRAGFARVWEAGRAVKEKDSRHAAALLERVAEYNHDLRELGVEDHHLDRDQKASAVTIDWAILARDVAVFLFLAPFALVGYVTNGPTHLVIGQLARRFGRQVKDRASIRVLVGIIALPVTWTVIGLFAAYWSRPYVESNLTSMGIGVIAAVLSAIGMPASLFFARVAAEMTRAMRIGVTRKRHGISLERLRRQRSALFDVLVHASDGVELPGRVLPDGRIASDFSSPS